MLRQFQRERLSDAVAEEIKRYIGETGLREGDKLPPERDLCQQLNISRTSLREALQQLQMLGLIELRHGQGAYVKQDHLESFLARASGPLLRGSAEILDLLEVREALEVFAIGLATERRTEDHLQRLRERLNADQVLVAAQEYGAEEDLEFHSLLFQATSNKILESFVQFVGKMLRSVREARLADPKAHQETLEEHTGIFEALRDRDQMKATRLIRRQCRATAEKIMAQMQQDELARQPSNG